MAATLQIKAANVLGAPAAKQRPAALDSVTTEMTLLKHADGMTEPSFEAGAEQEAPSLGAARWLHGIMGLVVLFYAGAVAISSVAMLLPLNSTLFTNLVNDGYRASNWNLGAAFGFAMAVIGLAEAALFIPQLYDIVENAISKQNVNGMRTVLNAALAIVYGWFLLQISYAHDVIVVISLVLIGLAGVLFEHTGERENSRFMAAKLTPNTKVTKSSYYLTFAYAGGYKLALFLLWGTFAVDGMYYDAAQGFKTHLWVLAATGTIEGVYMILGAALTVARYARCDSGCITPAFNYEAVHTVLRSVRSLWGVSAYLVLFLLGNI